MTIEEKRQKYFDLCHAMQTGVAYKMEKDVSDTTPKHLRVGVNSAMVDSAALARVLMAKGVFTEGEYFHALIATMTDEVEKYQAWLSAKYGREIKLA